MILTTFNIQHCRDYVKRIIDFDLIAEAIEKTNPDIVSLNEVFGEGSPLPYDNQPKILAEKLNMFYFFGQAISITKGNYGNAILSKYPIEDPQVIKIPDPLVKDEDVYYETRCIIKAKINGLTILSTHIGLAKSEARNAVNTLLEVIKDIKGPYVIMGDFNMQPNNEILKPLFALTNDTLENIFTPTFPSINPKIRIDYILTSKDITIEEANVVNIIASDHLPVRAKIKS